MSSRAGADAPRRRGTAAAPRPGRLAATLRWVGTALIVTVAAVALLLLNSTAPQTREELDPEATGPTGTRALARILAEQGASVEIAHGRDEAARLLDDDEGAGDDDAPRPATTLVLTAPVFATDPAMEGIHDLSGHADRVVFLSADERTLSFFDLGKFAGSAFGESVAETGSDAEAGCPEPRFAEVGEISAQTTFTPASGVRGCFTAEDGSAALLLTSGRSPELAVVDAVGLFDNANLATGGNAALAFALLVNAQDPPATPIGADEGGGTRIVWLVPSAEDLATDVSGSIAALTPGWVTPVMLILLLTGLAAAVWRGRRFGPLVEEQLPVTVRASETMQGRARLTAQRADAAHAAATLREGALRRLRRRLGLPANAAAAEVAAALAARAGSLGAADARTDGGEALDRAALHRLLGGELPANDTALLEFARRLASVEDALPLPSGERNTP